MVPEIVRRLVNEQDDMEVVGDCRGPMKILQETGRTNADVVLLAQEGTNEPALCGQLLAVYPDLTIVGVAQDMTRTFTQQLCSYRTSVVCAKKENIISVLRTMVREPCRM